MAEWPWEDRIILSPEGLAFVLHVPTCHWLSVCGLYYLEGYSWPQGKGNREGHLSILTS